MVCRLGDKWKESAQQRQENTLSDQRTQMEQQGIWAATLKKAANKRSRRGSKSIKETFTASDRVNPSRRKHRDRRQLGLNFSRAGVFLTLGGGDRCRGGAWKKLDDSKGKTFRCPGDSLRAWAWIGQELVNHLPREITLVAGVPA